MGWVKLDDQRAMNRKLREAGFEARGLDEAAMCQVAADQTDGFISENTVEMLAVAHRCKAWRKVVHVLVTVERWEVVGGGWMIHDYLDFNPSKAEWEAEKDRKSAAGRRGGRASAQARGQAPASADGQAPASESAEASAQADPTRPDPIPLVLTSPPPLTVVREPDPAAEFFEEVVDAVARRQLAAAVNVRIPSGWLATARPNIAAEHARAIRAAFDAGQSVESIVDHLEPPPKPIGPANPSLAFHDRDCECSGQGTDRNCNPTGETA